MLPNKCLKKKKTAFNEFSIFYSRDDTTCYHYSLDDLSVKKRFIVKSELGLVPKSFLYVPSEAGQQREGVSSTNIVSWPLFVYDSWYSI